MAARWGATLRGGELGGEGGTPARGPDPVATPRIEDSIGGGTAVPKSGGGVGMLLAFEPARTGGGGAAESIAGGGGAAAYSFSVERLVDRPPSSAENTCPVPIDGFVRSGNGGEGDMALLDDQPRS